jgi:hypothetical protein
MTWASGLGVAVYAGGLYNGCMTRRGGKRWTRDEVDRLPWDWGSEPVTVTAERFGRTPQACRRKVQRLGMSASVLRGVHTVEGLARETGYHRKQIERGVQLSRKRLIRTRDTPRAPRIITEEQAEDIVQELVDEEQPTTIASVAEAHDALKKAAYYLAQTLGIRSGELSDGACADLVAAIVEKKRRPHNCGTISREIDRSRFTIYAVSRRLVFCSPFTDDEAESIRRVMAHVPTRKPRRSATVD